METVHPPKPAIPGTYNITQAVSAAQNGFVCRSPAGYKFMGRDVWRVEVAGTVGGNGVNFSLQQSSAGVFAPIAIRGHIIPTGNGYQRPLTCCANATNGHYAVVIRANVAGFGNSFVIGQATSTSPSRGTGFNNAKFKLQIDYIEYGP